jgi:hypothetical protein
MMFPIVNYPIQQGNPLLEGALKGSALYQNFMDTLAAHLANQKAKSLLPYAVPEEQAKIQETQARGKLYGAEAEEPLYKAAHPELYQPAEVQYLSSLLNMAQGGTPSQGISRSTQENISDIAQNLKNAGISGQDMLPTAATSLEAEGAPSLRPATDVMKPQEGETPLDYAKRTANLVAAESGTPGLKAPSVADYIPSLLPQTPQQQSIAGPQNLRQQLAESLIAQKLGVRQTPYQQKMTQAFNWVHSTPDMKNYQVAQLAGAGVDPSEGISQLASGKTVPEILQTKGFDPNNPPEPDFLPTHGSVEKLKQRQVALKEVESIGKFVENGLGPYSHTFFNLSPLQIKDALLGMNDEQQQNFLAARGLVPELTNLRLTLANARTTVHAQDQMLNNSLLQINQFRGLVSDKNWLGAQKKMDQQLKNAFEKANEAYSVGRRKETPDTDQTSKAFVYNGRTYNIPSDKVDAFIKARPGAVEQ